MCIRDRNYIFFGLYYFVLIFAASAFEPLIERGTARLGIRRDGVCYQIFQRTKLLIIVFIGEMFFRAATLTAGMEMFGKIFTDFRGSQLIDGTLLKLGISEADYGAVFFGFLVVLAVGVIHEKGISIRDKVAGFRLAPRWSIYYGAILLVIILGAYGPGYRPVDLIYAGF